MHGSLWPPRSWGAGDCAGPDLSGAGYGPFDSVAKGFLDEAGDSDVFDYAPPVHGHLLGGGAQGHVDMDRQPLSTGDLAKSHVGTERRQMPAGIPWGRSPSARLATQVRLALCSGSRRWRRQLWPMPGLVKLAFTGFVLLGISTWNARRTAPSS